MDEQSKGRGGRSGVDKESKERGGRRSDVEWSG